MRVEKTNFAVYTTHAKASVVSKSIDILEIIKKNNKEKKKEKVQKIYTLLGCGAGLAFMLTMFIYF